MRSEGLGAKSKKEKKERRAREIENERKETQYKAKEIEVNVVDHEEGVEGRRTKIKQEEVRKR